ncbi:serine-rich adhesin for platelets-like [Pieris brassicae]|uniref:serine-rich adhesin for platelets-like n=1 Tax=Pieris brassicae TaxID=7116 RepID=UPI001E660EDF|nr:serine-rich adhesin for platelets-like [Pieris brassicae]
MFCQVVLFSLIAGAFAAPPVDVVPLEKQQPTVIPIVSQSDELEANGTYHFSYETGNGIKRDEIAYEKVIPKARSANSNEGGEDDSESDEIHVQQGSYSYTGPDGIVYTVRYIADENGFQPIGDHLPRVPGNTQSSSAEKSGRALKSDSTVSASSPNQVQAVVPPPPASPVESKPAQSIQTAEPSVTADSDAKSSDSIESRVAEAPVVATVATSEASESVPANAEPASTESVSVSSSESVSDSSTTEKVESPVSTAAEIITAVPEVVSTAAPEVVSTAVPEVVSTTVLGDVSSTTSASGKVSTLATEPAADGISQEVSTEAQPSTTVSDQASSNADPATVEASSTTVSA